MERLQRGFRLAGTESSLSYHIVAMSGGRIQIRSCCQVCQRRDLDWPARLGFNAKTLAHRGKTPIGRPQCTTGVHGDLKVCGIVR